MQIPDLDLKFASYDKPDGDGIQDLKDAILWMEPEITQEQVGIQIEARRQILQALSKCKDGEAVQILQNLNRVPLVEKKPGKAYTIRRAILDALFADEFPNREDDHKESVDDKGMQASLVIKVQEAKKKLEITNKECDLIRRLAHECGQKMEITAQLFKHLG